MTLEVRESQIEDAFVGAGGLTRRILNLKDTPRLLARQMNLPAGRLDLLYVHRSDLILVELKAVGFKPQFLRQVLSYRDDLAEYQRQKKLLSGRITPYLLCTETTPAAESRAHDSGVVLTQYDPREILEHFYRNFTPITFFSETKPIDIGVWNLHLVNKFIYHLDSVNTVGDLLRRVGGSRRTLYNKIKFASELRLVRWTPNRKKIALTALGKSYVAARDENLPERIGDAQAELLRDFVMRNPYESSVALGIAAMVESVFVLAKNAYPVRMPHLIEYFPHCSGKHFDWQTDKAKFSGARMYSNYAVDLGLLAKTQDAVYMTPEGMRFTMQMQMHKNMKMFESARIF